MISIQLATLRQWGRGAFLMTAALAMVSCAGEVDDTTGSRLVQPAPNSPPVKPIPANDITIVGQEFGHAILDLPDIANAAVPPLVEFTGVTSIIASPTPIDTQPYTDLLRDRLLLITRLKLRYVEKTLPPLIVSNSKKGKKKASLPPVPAQNTTNPDYQILAELRGRYDADLYKIQVEFVNVQTGDVLLNELYSIRKEAQPDAGAPIGQPEVNPADDSMAPPPPPGTPDPNSPQPPPAPPAGASSGIQ
jgi:hypothetical protein